MIPFIFSNHTQPFEVIWQTLSQPTSPSVATIGPSSARWPFIAPQTSVSASTRKESVLRLREISELQDGWDGYGGYSPSVGVCEHAIRFIKETLAAKFPRLKSPEIAPTSNGTIMLSWDSDIGEAAIEIGDTKFSGYARRPELFVPIGGPAEFLGEDELSTIAECIFK